MGISKAIRHFWKTRLKQHKKQGARTGKRDYGSRSAVTGGAQLDGFIALLNELLVENGLPNANIHKKQTQLPGYFRPTKEWDLVVILDGQLLASIELKSHVGPSFGNNFNNRIEEALGSATDLWTSYREGAFSPSQRPWLGYLMLLEETPKSTTPIRGLKEPHFPVFEEFREASYSKRYEMFCERLLRERLYDGVCFLCSNSEGGLRGKYKESSTELSFKSFVISLLGRIVANIQNKR